jgi:hypothetical protein
MSHPVNIEASCLNNKSNLGNHIVRGETEMLPLGLAGGCSHKGGDTDTQQFPYMSGRRLQLTCRVSLRCRHYT